MTIESSRTVLGGREQVKVAIVQRSSAFMNRAASIERACTAIAEAAAQGAELIAFPEVWLAGYPFWTEGWDSQVGPWVEGRVRFREAALMAPSEDTERIGRAARAANAYVLLGCNEIDARPGVNTIYNTQLFFDRDGTLRGRHRKLMPTFIERVFWGQGDARDLVVYETDIGRIGSLICGEHGMPLVRAAMIAQGEDFHIAGFPGSFALHTGPQLQEPDTQGDFWGYAAARHHAFEAGAFVLLACGYQDPADIGDDFPHKGKMNVGWANGGSAVIAPLGVPVAPRTYGDAIVYADCQAFMIKALKSIVDSVGHYARPDLLRLMVRHEDGWQAAGPREPVMPLAKLVRRDELRRAADAREVDEAIVEEIAERVGVARA